MNGVAAGRDVFHAQVHIVPRYEEDGIIIRWPYGKLTDESGRNLALAIRDELGDSYSFCLTMLAIVLCLFDV